MRKISALWLRRGFLFAACLGFMAGWNLPRAQAQGMKVTFRDGKELIATRAVFDGRDFRILAAGVEIRKPWAEVVSIETEGAAVGAASGTETDRLRQSIVSLEKKNAELTLRILDSETLAGKWSQEEADLNRRLRDLDDRLDRLTREKAALEKDKQNLTEQIALKDGDIAILKETIRTKPTPEAVRKPNLEISRQAASESPLAGATRITGLIANRDRVSYQTVVLEISALDANDKVLGVAHTFLTHLEPGSRRPFTVDIETAFASGLQIQVVPALAAVAGGGDWRKAP